MVTIRIKDLRVNTVLGIHGWEQKQKRPVLLNLAIDVENGGIYDSDKLANTVDYAMIESLVTKHLEKATYKLIETLVADIGKLVLALDPRILRVYVEADKPGALQHAASVSVAGMFCKNV